MIKLKELRKKYRDKIRHNTNNNNSNLIDNKPLEKELNISHKLKPYFKNISSLNNFRLYSDYTKDLFLIDQNQNNKKDIFGTFLDRDKVSKEFISLITLTGSLKLFNLLEQANTIHNLTLLFSISSSLRLQFTKILEETIKLNKDLENWFIGEKEFTHDITDFLKSNSRTLYKVIQTYILENTKNNKEYSEDEFKSLREFIFRKLKTEEFGNLNSYNLSTNNFSYNLVIKRNITQYIKKDKRKLKFEWLTFLNKDKSKSVKLTKDFKKYIKDLTTIIKKHQIWLKVYLTRYLINEFIIKDDTLLNGLFLIYGEYKQYKKKYKNNEKYPYFESVWEFKEWLTNPQTSINVLNFIYDVLKDFYIDVSTPKNNIKINFYKNFISKYNLLTNKDILSKYNFGDFHKLFNTFVEYIKDEIEPKNITKNNLKIFGELDKLTKLEVIKLIYGAGLIYDLFIELIFSPKLDVIVNIFNGLEDRDIDNTLEKIINENFHSELISNCDTKEKCKEHLENLKRFSKYSVSFYLSINNLDGFYKNVLYRFLFTQEVNGYKEFKELVYKNLEQIFYDNYTLFNGDEIEDLLKIYKPIDLFFITLRPKKGRFLYYLSDYILLKLISFVKYIFLPQVKGILYKGELEFHNFLRTYFYGLDYINEKDLKTFEARFNRNFIFNQFIEKQLNKIEIVNTSLKVYLIKEFGLKLYNEYILDKTDYGIKSWVGDSSNVLYINLLLGTLRDYIIKELFNSNIYVYPLFDIVLIYLTKTKDLDLHIDTLQFEYGYKDLDYSNIIKDKRIKNFYEKVNIIDKYLHMVISQEYNDNRKDFELTYGSVKNLLKRKNRNIELFKKLLKLSSLI